MALEFADLNPAEQCVAEACARGELARVRPSDGAVRAELLRQLLLRLPCGDGFAEPFAVRLPGVRVEGATILGALDLRDCAGAGGDGLPALELVGCTLTGPVDLSHAKLARLSFRRSRFTQIVAHGVRIEGPFDFSEGGFAEGDSEGVATVDLTGADIAGEVLGRGARLRLERRHGEASKPWAHRYAVRLSDANVRGNLNLNDGFYADGGATISASLISGEVWLSRATLIAGESNAFNARGAVINGPVMMTDGFRAYGRVGLRGAEIKGDVTFGRERATPQDGEPPRDRSTVHGVLDLRGALIEGSVELSGSTFENVHDWAVNAAGARIGDDVAIKAPADAGDDRLTLVAGGLRFEGAKIGGEFIWDGLAFTAPGPERTLLNLADATIERALKPRQLFLRVPVGSSRERPCIDLTGARCAALDDSLEQGWGPSTVRLKLDGFVYGRLERDADHGGKRSSSDRWAKRKKWLQERGEWDGYHPQPYTHLARVYAAAGWSDDMRRVLRRQRTLHANQEERLWMRPIMLAHWLIAGYGHAPHRAVGSLLVYLVLGWAGVEYARQRQALVVDVTPVSALVQPVSVSPADAPACGDQVTAPLYALDVAVPLLDLRQESECEPGAAPGAQLFAGYPIPGTRWAVFEEVAVWRWAKALYALLGAIMTALAVLTFSGVMQRRDT